MFIGHFGVALASKRFAPRTSLGTLFFAAEFLDLLWPIFLLFGLEHVRIVPGITRMQPLDFYDYPITHSLVSATLWAVVAGCIYYGVRRYARGGWVVGLLVVSHWVLDYIVHRPDLPLWPGSTKVGLGLWNSWLAGSAVEVFTFAVGLWVYLRSTRARDATGKYAFWSLMALVFFGWAASLFSVPPNPQSLAWTALSMWLLVLWGWWADAHRDVIPDPSLAHS